MINKLLKIIWGKELILFSFHRNLKPLVNEVNKKKYVFFNPIKIWKATGIVGRRSRLRYKLYYGILTILDPVYIINVNWIATRHSLYYVWCNNNDRSFVVVQHGIYHGGIVKFIPEKYVKCNIFLVWGEHFKKMFEENNKGKDFHCISFGNPCYNEIDRKEFSYNENVGNSVLIAVSVMKDQRLRKLYSFLEKLRNLGFDINVKEHAMQVKKTSVPIEGYHKITDNLYDILKEQKYDIVVTDVSSAMTDIIFFKTRALYFSPEEAGSDLNENVYSEYLENIAPELETVKSREDVFKYIDLEAQENLLRYLIKTENTSNELSQIEDYLEKSTNRENRHNQDAKVIH